jgi:hypothetical protein
MGYFGSLCKQFDGQDKRALDRNLSPKTSIELSLSILGGFHSSMLSKPHTWRVQWTQPLMSRRNIVDGNRECREKDPVAS